LRFFFFLFLFLLLTLFPFWFRSVPPIPELFDSSLIILYFYSLILYLLAFKYAQLYSSVQIWIPMETKVLQEQFFQCIWTPNTEKYVVLDCTGEGHSFLDLRPCQVLTFVLLFVKFICDYIMNGLGISTLYDFLHIYIFEGYKSQHLLIKHTYQEAHWILFMERAAMNLELLLKKVNRVYIERGEGGMSVDHSTLNII